MKFVDKRNDPKWEYTVELVKEGECFEYSKIVYMKGDQKGLSDNSVWCMDMYTGHLESFRCTTHVNPIDTCFTIQDFSLR